MMCRHSHNSLPFQFEETALTTEVQSNLSEFEGWTGTRVMSSYTHAKHAEEVDLELRVARFERLMNRRPELLSSVLLRQNPHNVEEWLKRAQLFDTNPSKVQLMLATVTRHLSMFADHNDVCTSRASCRSEAGHGPSARALDRLCQLLREK